MIKKIFSFIFLIFLVIGCGKKGDPVYKEQKTKIPTTEKTIIL